MKSDSVLRIMLQTTKKKSAPFLFVPRSRPYSFGLGKRSVDEDQSSESQPLTSDLDQAALAEFFDQYDDAGKLKQLKTLSVFLSNLTK